MNLHEHKFLHIQIIEHVYQPLTSEDYVAK